MTHTKALHRDPRLTSRGYSTEKGEHATISLPQDTEAGLIVSYFLKRITDYTKHKFPDELKARAEIAFSFTKKRLLVRLNIKSEDVRSEVVMDKLVDDILALSKDMFKERDLKLLRSN